MTTEAIVGIGLSAFLVFLWGDDMVETYRDWKTYHDPRAFRTLLKASLLAAGAVAFLLGAISAYYDPRLLDAARFWGWVVRAGLLVIGVVIFITRLRD